MNPIPFLSLVLFCSLAVTVHADFTLGTQLQQILDEEIERHQTHGVSAAVIFADGTSWTGVSGVSHDTISIRPDMLFAIGSVTKNVVAALILKLVEDGLLSLEDP